MTYFLVTEDYCCGSDQWSHPKYITLSREKAFKWIDKQTKDYYTTWSVQEVVQEPIH